MIAPRKPLTIALAIGAVVGPAATHADARPFQRPVTIQAAPRVVTAGDPVVVFGRAPAGSDVTLFHRINPQHFFSPIGHTTADAAGRYEFQRPDGVVLTNRNWFVRSSGHHSRIVHEKVRALLTLAGPADPNVVTGTPTAFTGTVSPAHAGETLLLQRQNATSGNDRWNRIDQTTIQADGSYAFNHRFRYDGDANVRVLLRADRVNIKSPSNVLSLQIEQAQNPNLTINASANPLREGDSVTLTGTLANTTAARPVTLLAKTVRGRFSPVAQGTTDASGNYTFTQTPVANTFYKVSASPDMSAQLFVGVNSVVTASADQTDVVAGSTVTFSGSVSPDETGRQVFLERRNANGQDWHVIAKARVESGSTFSIPHQVNVPGSPVFRVLIAGGPRNQRGISDPITITVTQNATPLS